MSGSLTSSVYDLGLSRLVSVTSLAGAAMCVCVEVVVSFIDKNRISPHGLSLLVCMCYVYMCMCVFVCAYMCIYVSVWC